MVRLDVVEHHVRQDVADGVIFDEELALVIGFVADFASVHPPPVVGELIDVPQRTKRGDDGRVGVPPVRDLGAKPANRAVLVSIIAMPVVGLLREIRNVHLTSSSGLIFVESSLVRLRLYGS